jgi:carboxyl-terminal processing protease
MPMNRRFRFGPPLVAMSLSLLLGFGLARALLATDDLQSQLTRFSQVLYLVQNNYVEVPENEKLVKGAIDGMLRTLDPHSVFLVPERAKQMDESFHGEYSGIGIQFDILNGVITVISPIEGTPAFRLGIRAGDQMISIDDKPVAKTVTNEDVFKMLRGPAGSTVKVTILREGDEEPRTFAIERAKIPIESIPYAFMIRPGVGYIRVIRFASTTGDELDKALETLKGQGMKSLMLDLRANGGGLLSQAVDVLDQLVPQNKKVVYTRGRITSANADYFSSDRPKIATGPIVVLVDHGSASASEIVSGAIQDLDRGLVAGTNTFGKGLVQNQFNLSDGSKLLLTIAKYYTPSGRLIQRDYSKFTDMSDYQADAFREEAPTDSELAARPKFKTSGGRTVYGGGGILPDVIVGDPPLLTRTEADMIQKRVFFEWGTHYLAQRKDHKFTAAELAPNAFTLSAKDWDNLKALVAKEKVTMNDSLWNAEKPFMQRQVRVELAGATLGPIERYKVLIEEDTQLTAALDLFPQASALLAGNYDEAKKGTSPKKTPPRVPSTANTDPHKQR